MSIMDYRNFRVYSEAYEVVKAVRLVAHNGKTYRIDIEQSHSESTKPYRARYYEELDVLVQPTYPQEKSVSTSKPRSVRAWVTSNKPSASGDSVDSVLAQALAYLAYAADHEPNE